MCFEKSTSNKKGNYILVTGPSLMADNPYFGEFEMEPEA
jgi:hypothetical protein